MRDLSRSATCVSFLIQPPIDGLIRCQQPREPIQVILFVYNHTFIC